jgi:hypothetical protein
MNPVVPIDDKKKELYKIIQDLSKQLTKEESMYTRADLAYELKNYGFEIDSVEVSDAVWNAYLYYRKDKNILNAFRSNYSFDLLVPDSEVRENASEDRRYASTMHLDKMAGSFDELQKTLETDLIGLQEFINNPEKRMGDPMQSGLVRGLTRASEYVEGTKGIKDVQYESEVLQSGLNEVCNSYTAEASMVKGATSYFSKLREELLAVYYKYSGILLDLYGDQIRKVEPELFDYNSISYLDVQTIVDSVLEELSFIQESSGIAVAHLTEGVNQIRTQFVDTLKKTKDLRVAAVEGVVNFASHHLSAIAETKDLKRQLEKAKRRALDTVVRISADEGRLIEVFKILNDLIIPKAIAFYRHADKVLSREVDGILALVYSSEELRGLYQQREQLLDRLVHLNRSIEDADVHRALYERQAQEMADYLEENLTKYQAHVWNLPKRPSMLQRILTLDRASEQYNGILNYLKKNGTMDFIDNYICTKVWHQLTQNALDDQNALYNSCCDEINEINVELDQISQQIYQVLGSDKKLRQKFSSHLVPLVGLLRGARTVIELSLEESLTRPKEIKLTSEMFDVPEDIKKKLNTMALLGHQAVNNMAENAYSQEELEAKQSDKPLLVEERAARRNEIDREAECVHKLVDVTHKFVELGLEKEQTKRATEEYSKEFERLKAEFQQRYAEIDDKADAIREALKIINTTDNQDSMAKGLLLLADVDVDSLTDEEMEDFLMGKKTIKL